MEKENQAEKQNPTNELLNEKQLKINELQGKILELQGKNQEMSLRTLKVHEENQMYKASPQLAEQMAEMQFHLSMAERFIKSNAFKVPNAESAYVLIKAGGEMGLKPVESMQALYIVNGAVKPHGAGMAAIIAKNGYRMQFLNETKDGVTLRVTHENGFDETEVVKATDQVFQKSRSFQFARKNKMRFHAIRMFASFHLAHLFGSVEDEFTSDFREWDKDQPKGIEIEKTESSKEKERVLNHLNNAKTIEQLQQIDNAVKQYGLETEYLEKMDELQTLVAV